MSRQEEQLDAAEYVIGTLTPVERMAFDAALESDDQARADVAFWENVFGDMGAAAPEVPLTADLWPKIEKRLQDNHIENAEQLTSSLAARTANVTSGTVIATDAGTHVASATEVKSSPTISMPETTAANDNTLRRSRGLWRAGAIAASLAALGLGAALFNGEVRQRVDGVLNAGLTNTPGQATDDNSSSVASGKSYIAVVNAPDQPAMIVKVNPENGSVTVRSLGVEKPEGKSLELWYVSEGEKPVSMGLVDEGDIDLGNVKAKNGDLLAISVEPAGGSPNETASGPVIYTGKLIEDAQ